MCADWWHICFRMKNICPNIREKFSNDYQSWEFHKTIIPLVLGYEAINLAINLCTLLVINHLISNATVLHS